MPESKNGANDNSVRDNSERDIPAAKIADAPAANSGAEKVGALSAEAKSTGVTPSGEAARAPRSASSAKDVPARETPPRSDERLRPPSSAKELILDQLPIRARRASPRLHEHLTGQVFLEIVDSHDRYLCDWKAAELKTALAPAATKSVPTPGSEGGEVSECTIRISEDNLLRIVNGDLNPQVGMLSEKIRVSGKLSMAVYFFNLVATN